MGDTIMRIVGVILAAGASSRIGKNKLLLPFKHHTVIEEVIYQLSKSDVDNILLITGFESRRIEKLIDDNAADRIRIVFNDKYRLGRAESIKCAVKSAGRDTDALSFMVADKPTVSSGLINRAIDMYKQKSPGILYIKTPTGRGHPIIFSKEFFPELMVLNGDTVGEELIAGYKEKVIELEDDEIQVDIDTQDDYKSILKRVDKRKS